MYLPKTEIYNSLKNINKDYFVAQYQPPTFNKVPAIIFRVGDNAINTDLDNTIASQEIEIIIDLYAMDSITASNVLNEVESALRSLEYRLTYCSDVPNAGNLHHINGRFYKVFSEEVIE